MTWNELVKAVTARHSNVMLGMFFGMPCLKRADGKVIACLWKDGGIAVKLVDEAARAEALALPLAGLRGRNVNPLTHSPAPIECVAAVARALVT